MEFRLTYEGKLLSTRSGTKNGIDIRWQHKHNIRKHFQKQIRELYNIHPVLNRWANDPKSGLYTGVFEVEGKPKPLVELVAEKFSDGYFNWVPLITDFLKVNCSIKILYLKKGARGNVVGQADLDNRVKTIIDALKMPKFGEIDKTEKPESNENPFFVLLEDDSMITHLSVESDTLLCPTNPQLGETDSRVVITVRIWPYVGNGFNSSLA